MIYDIAESEHSITKLCMDIFRILNTEFDNDEDRHTALSVIDMNLHCFEEEVLT